MSAWSMTSGTAFRLAIGGFALVLAAGAMAPAGAEQPGAGNQADRQGSKPAQVKPARVGVGGDNVQYSPNSVGWAQEETPAIKAMKDWGVEWNMTSDGHVFHVFFRQNKQYPDEALANLKNFPRMRSVDLMRALFNDDSLKHLEGLTQLDSITLTGMNITDAGLAHLAGLTNLTGINLECPNITDEGLKHLTGMTGLYLLRLNGTKITDAGLAYLAKLPSLGYLELKDTAVTDEGLKHLAGLTNLNTLYLGGTKVADHGLVHLGKLCKLNTLDLGRTNITDSGLATLLEFEALKNVHILFVDHTNITDAGMAYLAQLTLNGLEISNTRITDKGLEQLTKLSGWLTIYKTGVTRDGLQELRRRCPGLNSISADVPSTPSAWRVPASCPTSGPKDAQAVAELIEKLRAGPRWDKVDQKVVDQLAAMGAPAIGPLLDAVEQDTSIYQSVGRVFANMGPEMMPKLLEIVRQDKKRVARFPVWWALKLKGVEGVPLLIELLTDQSDEVRLLAVDTLYDMSIQARAVMPESLVAPLTTALKDRNENVRRQIPLILGRIESARASVIPTLIQTLQGEQDQLAYNAALGLGYCGRNLKADDPNLNRILDALIAALDGKNPTIRGHAASALGTIGPNAASVLPALRRASDTGDPWVIRSTTEAISRIENPTSRPGRPSRVK